MSVGMIEMRCSGSFKSQPGTDKDRVPFNNVKVVIPYSEKAMADDIEGENYRIFYASRMFRMARLQDKECKEHNFEGLIKIYVDDFKHINGKPSCVGKDIKHMEWADLQDLACILPLREIPFLHDGNVRSAKEKAYETYMKVIKKHKVIKTEKDLKVLREDVKMSVERRGMSPQELEDAINSNMPEVFDMRPGVYSFNKLPPIIPVKEWTEKIKEAELAGASA